MKSIDRYRFGPTPNLLYYSLIHLSRENITKPGIIEQTIMQDCYDSEISAEEFADSKIVVLFLAEGHDADDIKPLTDRLQHSHFNRFMVVFNSVVDVDTLDYFAVSAKDWLIKGSHSWNLNQQFDFATIVPKNKFLCLMRRPSVSRAKLGQFIIENIGLENVLMSFGSMSQFGLKGYRSYFPNHELPILIDGLVSTGEMFYDMVYKPNFYSCVFNIIAESSSQSDEYVYRSIFLTEKTWKSVIQHQIPIWYGVPGLVRAVRSLGFDVFDDVIDHAYDYVEDETQRYKMVFDEIVRINKRYSLDQCHALRLQLKSRLENNYQHFRQREALVIPQVKTHIQKFINI